MVLHLVLPENIYIYKTLLKQSYIATIRVRPWHHLKTSRCMSALAISKKTQLMLGFFIVPPIVNSVTKQFDGLFSKQKTFKGKARH
jgi:hypothetical protein